MSRSITPEDRTSAFGLYQLHRHLITNPDNALKYKWWQCLEMCFSHSYKVFRDINIRVLYYRRNTSFISYTYHTPTSISTLWSLSYVTITAPVMPRHKPSKQVGALDSVTSVPQTMIRQKNSAAASPNRNRRESMNKLT